LGQQALLVLKEQQDQLVLLLQLQALLVRKAQQVLQELKVFRVHKVFRETLVKQVLLELKVFKV
jgi:hypothetical protein